MNYHRDTHQLGFLYSVTPALDHLLEFLYSVIPTLYLNYIIHYYFEFVNAFLTIPYFSKKERGLPRSSPAFL